MGNIEIVCLANSRKISGRCIAGKIIESKKWIRPVSNRDGEEISEEERRYKNGQMPKLRDIISIPIKEHRPKFFQNENYLIDDAYYWGKTDVFNGNLKDYLDYPQYLWGTDSSSNQGENDRIPEENCSNYNDSLYLIKPQTLKIIVQVEYPGYEYEKRKVRAEFKYNDTIYIFPVTDPVIEQKYLSGGDGDFILHTENIYLCVSVGLPYNDFCYKFLASIIETE